MIISANPTLETPMGHDLNNPKRDKRDKRDSATRVSRVPRLSTQTARTTQTTPPIQVTGPGALRIETGTGPRQTGTVSPTK